MNNKYRLWIFVAVALVMTACAPGEATPPSSTPQVTVAVPPTTQPTAPLAVTTTSVPASTTTTSTSAPSPQPSPIAGLGDFPEFPEGTLSKPVAD